MNVCLSAKRIISNKKEEEEEEEQTFFDNFSTLYTQETWNMINLYQRVIIICVLC